MRERLSRQEKLQIYHQLCRHPAHRHLCRDAREARTVAEALVGSPRKMTFSSDYVLMRAIDRFCAGELSIEDLYRCRILAYVMLFGEGGEEWREMGVALGVRMGGPGASDLPVEERPERPEDDLLEP